MTGKTVMGNNKRQSRYLDENPNATPSNQDFFVKKILYQEYKEALRKGFKGTYENYLQYRDWE